MRDHSEAIDYDLMTRLGIRLRDVPVAIGWHGLAVFTRHLPADSALARSMHPEFDGWTREMMMLADVYDAVRWVQWQVAALFAKSRPPEPKPYPRPWDKKPLKYGSGAIRVADFNKWYYGGES